MIENVIYILVAALVLLIVWWVIGMFINEPRIMKIIGLILGLILLLYALSVFNVPLFKHAGKESNLQPRVFKAGIYALV